MTEPNTVSIFSFLACVYMEEISVSSSAVATVVGLFMRARAPASFWWVFGRRVPCFLLLVRWLSLELVITWKLRLAVGRVEDGASRVGNKHTPLEYSLHNWGPHRDKWFHLEILILIIHMCNTALFSSAYTENDYNKRISHIFRNRIHYFLPLHTDTFLAMTHLSGFVGGSSISLNIRWWIEERVGESRRSSARFSLSINTVPHF